MPDLASFAEKVHEDATTRGIRPAAASAVAETAAWIYSRLRDRHKPGRLIWDEEWDICLVLDATRYDQWQTVTDDHTWLGDTSAWSAGSASPEWYGHTFTPSRLPDDERIGLVTANPFAAKPAHRMPEWLRDATPVHEHLDYTDYVFEDSWGCTTEQGYLDVTHPRDVTARAHHAWHGESLDRLVVHYMQPHLPFRSRPEWFGARCDLDRFGEPDEATDGQYDGESKEIWKCVRDGDIPRHEVWDAYCDNLDWVLEHVTEFVHATDATVLLTSDHGNALGEWGLWSHPPGMQVAALRRVPWVIYDSSGDATYHPDPTNSPQEHGRSLDDQLQALGYID